MLQERLCREEWGQGVIRTFRREMKMGIIKVKVCTCPNVCRGRGLQSLSGWRISETPVQN